MKGRLMCPRKYLFAHKNDCLGFSSPTMTATFDQLQLLSLSNVAVIKALWRKLELLIGTRESKDSRVQAGLASPSPLQRTRETRQITLKMAMKSAWQTWACFKAENPIYWTRESMGTSESYGGESKKMDSFQL